MPPTIPGAVANLYAQSVLNLMTGWIMLWEGAIVDIPEGWSLCDGTNGTPDLRDKFVIGAGDSYAPDDADGDIDHNHTFEGIGHLHTIAGGVGLLDGYQYVPVTTTVKATGTFDNDSAPPPYYALAYIMRTG